MNTNCINDTDTPKNRKPEISVWRYEEDTVTSNLVLGKRKPGRRAWKVSKGVTNLLWANLRHKMF